MIEGTHLTPINTGTDALAPGRWVARATAAEWSDGRRGGIHLIAFRITGPHPQTVRSLEREIADRAGHAGLAFLRVRRTGDA